MKTEDEIAEVLIEAMIELESIEPTFEEWEWLMTSNESVSLS